MHNRLLMFSLAVIPLVSGAWLALANAKPPQQVSQRFADFLRRSGPTHGIVQGAMAVDGANTYVVERLSVGTDGQWVIVRILPRQVR